MEVAITERPESRTANAADLAAEYKYRGFDKFRAWDQLVIDRGLKPEMNAKEFYNIFDSVSPAPMFRSVRVNFEPTHYDELLKIFCQITPHEHHFSILWADGATGSNPNTYPENERFTPIEKGAKWKS